MPGVIPFNDLFPVATEPSLLHRLFGFNPTTGNNEGVTIAQIKSLMDNSAPAWADITGKPETFAPSAHGLSTHSDVSNDINSAPDGTIIKKIAGVWTAWAPDYLSAETDPIFSSHAAFGVTATKISNWDQAHGWGNPAGKYRPISYVPTWAEITGKPSTFAPGSHALENHSDAAGLAGAANGTIIKKIGGVWTAWTPDYLDSSYVPPPDASIDDALRSIGIGEINAWNLKTLEFADFPDYTIPIYFQGIPLNSGITGEYTENPYSPEDPEYDPDFTPELARIVFPVPAKGVPATQPDEIPVLSQIPIPFSGSYDDLTDVPLSFPPSAHSHPLSQLDQSGATTGQAAVWNGTEWAPGTVAGGGGADTNAVHYNVSDGKTTSEKAQARTNIGSKSGIPQIVSTTGTINNLAYTSNCIIFTGGAAVTLAGLEAGEDGEEIMIVNYSAANLIIANNGSGSDSANRFRGQIIIYRYGVSALVKYRASLAKWVVQDLGLFYSDTANGFRTINPIGINTAPVSNIALNVRAIGNTAAFTALFLTDLSGNQILNVNATGVVYMPNKAQVGGAPTPSANWTVRGSGTTTGVMIEHYDSASSLKLRVRDNGDMELQQRSLAFNSIIRRDEKRLYELVSITTSGSIINQALTDGIFNYRFTAATDISGFANGEIGRTIDIDNATGSTITFLHENAGSIAANRFNLIGAIDLVIPINGKVTLKYCTGSRWELVSKNF